MKTFSPIIKDINRQQVYGNQMPNSSPEKRSKSIKAYRRKFFKIMIALVIINIIGALCARDFMLQTADDYIDAEYDRRENKTTTV
jgi:hypothetical protein